MKWLIPGVGQNKHKQGCDSLLLPAARKLREKSLHIQKPQESS